MPTAQRRCGYLCRGRLVSLASRGSAWPTIVTLRRQNGAPGRRRDGCMGAISQSSAKSGGEVSDQLGLPSEDGQFRERKLAVLTVKAACAFEAGRSLAACLPVFVSEQGAHDAFDCLASLRPSESRKAGWNGCKAGESVIVRGGNRADAWREVSQRRTQCKCRLCEAGLSAFPWRGASATRFSMPDTAHAGLSSFMAAWIVLETFARMGRQTRARV